MKFFLGIIDVRDHRMDELILARAADLMAPIGPDGQSRWSDEGVGFCQVFFESGGYDKRDAVLRKYCDRYVIAGEIRIDARDEILGKLESRGCAVDGDSSDYEILLHGWRVWGRGLTRHLIGDFAVVIWDARERSLFAIRDHMGVRPFYYARIGRRLLVTNVLNSLRLFPEFSADLNDQAVVDFLAFGFNTRFDTTVYRHIRQLPPAHTLHASGSSVETRRYWRLPVEQVDHYRNVYDYVERFREQLDRAVKDRVPAGRLGIAMSGGLDSTSVAASASLVRGASHPLTLFSMSIKSLWPEDSELEYARLTASQLGARLVTRDITAEDLFRQSPELSWSVPEPSAEPFLTAQLEFLATLSENSRVALSGQGSDGLMKSAKGHLGSLVSRRLWRRLFVDAVRYVRVFGKRPPLSIRSVLKTRFVEAPPTPVMPVWLPAKLAAETGLHDRFASYYCRSGNLESAAHRERPEAYLDLASPLWPGVFVYFDPQTTGVPVDFRHPFMDVRLIRLALRMPAMPWFYDKQLLRAAGKGRLPEPVRTRAKARTSSSPVLKAILDTRESKREFYLQHIDRLERYVDIGSFLNLFDRADCLRSEEERLLRLPIALSFWDGLD